MKNREVIEWPFSGMHIITCDQSASEGRGPWQTCPNYTVLSPSYTLRSGRIELRLPAGEDGMITYLCASAHVSLRHPLPSQKPPPVPSAERTKSPSEPLLDTLSFSASYAPPWRLSVTFSASPGTPATKHVLWTQRVFNKYLLQE